MLREVCVVCYGVEGWRVEFGECGVRVLAVKALLKAIDPKFVRFLGVSECGGRFHIVFQLKCPS